jgi:hypothetical protein
MELILFISSVANSCQYFPAKKFDRLEKIRPLTNFDLLKAFGLKIKISVYLRGKSNIFFSDLRRIADSKRKKTNF